MTADTGCVCVLPHSVVGLIHIYNPLHISSQTIKSVEFILMAAEFNRLVLKLQAKKS